MKEIDKLKKKVIENRICNSENSTDVMNIVLDYIDNTSDMPSLELLLLGLMDKSDSESILYWYETKIILILNESDIQFMFFFLENFNVAFPHAENSLYGIFVSLIFEDNTYEKMKTIISNNKQKNRDKILYILLKEIEYNQKSINDVSKPDKLKYKMMIERCTYLISILV